MNLFEIWKQIWRSHRLASLGCFSAGKPEAVGWGLNCSWVPASFVSFLSAKGRIRNICTDSWIWIPALWCVCLFVSFNSLHDYEMKFPERKKKSFTCDQSLQVDWLIRTWLWRDAMVQMTAKLWILCGILSSQLLSTSTADLTFWNYDMQTCGMLLKDHNFHQPKGWWTHPRPVARTLQIALWTTRHAHDCLRSALIYDFFLFSNYKKKKRHDTVITWNTVFVVASSHAPGSWLLMFGSE